VGNFSNLPSTDADFQYKSNGTIHFAIYSIVLAKIAFYSQKAEFESIFRSFLNSYLPFINSLND
jgi:hypothetical protein